MPAAARNDLALFETGLVFHPREEQRVAAHLPVDRRPSDEEIAALNAALPEQPRHVARRPRGRSRAVRLVGQGPSRGLGRRRRGGACRRP